MKKLLTFVAAIVLLVTCFSVAALAAGPVISVPSIEADPGDTVTIEISLSGNTGFTAYNLDLIYDDALELTSLEAGDFSDGMFVPNVDEGMVALINYTEVTDDGVLFKATFKIADNAKGFFPISVSIINLGKDNIEMGASVSYGSIKVGTGECQHETTKVAGAVNANINSDGYTGDTVCSSCGKVFEKGSVIPKLTENEDTSSDDVNVDDEKVDNANNEDVTSEDTSNEPENQEVNSTESNPTGSEDTPPSASNNDSNNSISNDTNVDTSTASFLREQTMLIICMVICILIVIGIIVGIVKRSKRK